jgi:hypothetical protein
VTARAGFGCDTFGTGIFTAAGILGITSEAGDSRSEEDEARDDFLESVRRRLGVHSRFAAVAAVTRTEVPTTNEPRRAQSNPAE